MKITDFLKKYSLINEKFIDDFYSFYNDGKNEYDFTINLDNIIIASPDMGGSKRAYAYSKFLGSGPLKECEQ